MGGYDTESEREGGSEPGWKDRKANRHLHLFRVPSGIEPLRVIWNEIFIIRMKRSLQRACISASGTGSAGPEIKRNWT